MESRVSIIIRTKNEERWITQVLRGIAEQDQKNFEIIVVDNESSDKTLEKARKFGVKKVITCTQYLPGAAINMGIKEANGDYIAILSGHCIPVNNKWLGKLLRNFKESDVAGVYGRQEAMTFTPDSDKRDLALVFGLDRKIQKKDSFFHNANSMIRKDLWREIPFDETATNIEDRIWAQHALHRGHKIIYEPEASVYHYHGIHQNGNAERCTNVVRILENLRGEQGYRHIDISKLNISAIIPVRGPVQHINGKPLLLYTIQRALESKYIKQTIVSTDNRELAEIAKKLGAEAPFIRDRAYSEEHVNLVKVLQHSLEELEKLDILPDIVVPLEITFPFRPKGFLDEMILELARGGFDSVIAAKKENKAIWKEKGGSVIQLDEGIMPRKFKEPSFIGLKGLGSVTHPELLREGKFLGKKTGIHEVNNPYSSLEIRGEEDFRVASPLINEWFGK